MTTAALDRTVFPPADGGPELSNVAQALTGGAPAKLVGPDHREIEIPEPLYVALLDIVEALTAGRAVTIAPHDTMLSTQQAADMLNISRPTLVTLLDQGEISHERPGRGRHRKVRLADVLEYRERTRQARRAALRELTHDAVAAGLHDVDDEFVQTR
ncbi:Excisionase [Alloactinosynnema sp. L-07]|uniref:helix-turn-helix domain-containing protein n=1 Tax=Alloactinosynnema sp. L-07 TaxID=1653480 RepID=UPI00065F057E|nr:helix-turn-helix domain-containing protein [Alloactinosynnema sp. L-07]CRK60780.1 Excisionase [Alloactinosynnema sp. L-07]